MTAVLDSAASRFAEIAHKRASLRDLSRWRIGGPADLLLTPRTVSELSDVMKFVKATDLRHAVIGDGSNILFDDRGFRGVVVRIGSAFSHFEKHQGGQITAGAGLWVPDFVRRVIRSGLAGCVHAIGIPGRLGGLIVMNGGSQRKGIGDQLVDVTFVRLSGEIAKVGRSECAFGYRTSRMQESGDIVVEARFSYDQGEVGALRREALGILMERNQKFPRKLSNCGSVFLSNPEMYAEIGPPGRAIEEAGLKGARQNDAEISSHHANFIVNKGKASSDDILSLISLARRKVADRTGYLMDCEVRYLEPEGSFRMAHQVI